MDISLWNAALSLVSALILFWEIAKEYVTKSEVHTDINRVLDRLDRLEKKIDDFMKEQRSALG